jgi:C-terminal processing protease CtpA/Prc
MIRVAETGQFACLDGKWLIEGVGVTPDIEVDNLPARPSPGATSSSKSRSRCCARK